MWTVQFHCGAMRNDSYHRFNIVELQKCVYFLVCYRVWSFLFPGFYENIEMETVVESMGNEDGNVSGRVSEATKYVLPRNVSLSKSLWTTVRCQNLPSTSCHVTFLCQNLYQQLLGVVGKCSFYFMTTITLEAWWIISNSLKFQKKMAYLLKK